MAELGPEKRQKKIYKYCAEEIYLEANLCRFFGKNQISITEKVDKKLRETNGETSLVYFFIVWITRGILILSLFPLMYMTQGMVPSPPFFINLISLVFHKQLY